jgi:RNA polymerase sigma-70 factor (ECF subfamily)
MGPRLASHFLAALGPHAASPVDLARLENSLEARLLGARHAWPGIHLDASIFVAYLARRVGERQTVEEALRDLHTDDLYLACACAQGNEAAIERCDHLLDHLHLWVRRIDAETAFSDEVRQMVREKLFCGAAPKIADFAGRGPLQGWLRVICVNTAFRLRRERNPVPFERELTPVGDVELELLKWRYRDDFRSALEEAIADLSDRERLLLGLRFLDGLSIDEIGALYHVHRATAARWLAATRATLVQATRSALQQRLKLAPTELDSLLRLGTSYVEVSLPRLLRTPLRS